MSKQTQLTIGLVVVFAGLAGAMGWQYWHSQTVTQQASVQRQFVADFSTDAVNAIKIIQSDKTTLLLKIDDKWTLASSDSSTDTPLTDESAATALVQTVHDATIQATIATSAEQATMYGLDDASLTHVILQVEDKIVADITVGKIGKPSSTWYGSRSGDNTIYLLSGNRSGLIKDTWITTNSNTNAS